MGFMDNLKQLGDLKKMAEQAKEVQKRLDAIKITVEHKDVTVILTGNTRILSISGDDDLDKVTEAVNEGIKQAQKVAAQEMKGMMGGMGLPGM